MPVKDLQALLTDLEAGRVQHISFGDGVLGVFLKTAAVGGGAAAAAAAAVADSAATAGGAVVAASPATAAAALAAAGGVASATGKAAVATGRAATATATAAVTATRAPVAAAAAAAAASPVQYAVPVLPFLFDAVHRRLATLVIDQRVSTAVQPSGLGQRLSGLLVLLPFAYLVVMYFVMRRIMNRKETMSGKTQVSKGSGRQRLPTFADVAGIDKAKVEMQELVRTGGGGWWRVAGGGWWVMHDAGTWWVGVCEWVGRLVGRLLRVGALVLRWLVCWLVGCWLGGLVA